MACDAVRDADECAHVSSRSLGVEEQMLTTSDGLVRTVIATAAEGTVTRNVHQVGSLKRGKGRIIW